MNFADLRDLFENYTGVSESEVEDIDLALWFNEAQLDLAYDLGNIKSYTYEDGVASGEENDLPSDVINLVDSTSEYEITLTGKIIFTNSGTQTIYYRAIPTSFTGIDPDAKCELHEALHYLLAIFAASRYWDKESEGDSEESQHATKWMQYYYQGKNAALSKLSIVNNINKVDRWIIE